MCAFLTPGLNTALDSSNLFIKYSLFKYFSSYLTIYKLKYINIIKNLLKKLLIKIYKQHYALSSIAIE